MCMFVCAGQLSLQWKLGTYSNTSRLGSYRLTYEKDMPKYIYLPRCLPTGYLGTVVATAQGKKLIKTH